MLLGKKNLSRGYVLEMEVFFGFCFIMDDVMIYVKYLGWVID